MVINLYYKILMLQKTADILKALEEDLDARVRKMQVQVDNGITLGSAADILRAELLRVGQKMEVDAGMVSARSMMEVFTGIPVSGATVFVVPDFQADAFIFDNQRKETYLMKLQQERLLRSEPLLAAKYRPRVSWFGELGYGRPGLNMLDDDFDTYYLLGAGLQWRLWDWRNLQQEKKMLGLRSGIVETQKATFDQGIKASYADLLAQAAKFRQVIGKDEEIIRIRTSIVNTYASQLENGVITSTEYLIEKNAETRSKLDLEYHKIALSKTFMEYQLLMGKI